MKTLIIILDGAPEPEGSVFQQARMPHLQALAPKSMCGLWSGPQIVEGYNVKSMSELGMLGIFGYSPADSPGRGFMEALALGIQPREGEVYIRVNFATVDGTLTITDRRAGRDASFLEEIAKDLSTEIEGIALSLVKGKGHRGVLVLKGEGLSHHISDGDTGEEKPSRVHPLDQGAAKTARVVNQYLEWSHERLTKHALNAQRTTPANYLLSRSPGMMKGIQPFSERYGITAGAVGNDTIFNGMTAYLGMEVVTTRETGEIEDNLEEKLNEAKMLLQRKEMVFLHIKGPDTFSHDKDLEGKATFLEEVDAAVFGQLPEDTAVAIISDHATSCVTGDHTFATVPFLVFNGKASNGLPRFDEVTCQQGFREDNPMEKILSLVTG